MQKRLISITALANDYCVMLQEAPQTDKADFIRALTTVLPRIYWEFADFGPQEDNPSSDGENPDDLSDDGMVSLQEEPQPFFADYVDEEFYNGIKARLEALLGPEDTYLETFEEDMKYSDTPIAASISEGLADIFQALYNFVSTVKDTEGDLIKEAYLECRAKFTQYWSQTLCNTLRAVNNIRFGSSHC